MSTFSVSDIPLMTGRTIIVTGANSGLGRVTASVFAARGAHVVLAVRDLAKGREAAATMPGNVEIRQLDLADLASIRAFVNDFDAPVHLLINNAGLMIPPLGRTADGFELQFGTNHLGHFALTNLLLPQITGRIVTVSSNGHRVGSIDFADLNWHRKPYRALAAYGQSKLANLLFTAELQRRLAAAGSPVRAMAAHPGMAATNLFRESGMPRWLENMTRQFVLRFAQSDEEGTLPTFYAAVADIPGGSFAGPGGLLHGGSAPKLVSRSKDASNPDLARRLWAVSEQLTNVAFPGMQNVAS